MWVTYDRWELLSQKRGMKYILKKLQIYLLSKLAIVFLEIVLKLQCFFSIALTKAMLTLYSHKILIQTFHTIDLHPQETLLHSLAELLWVGWVSSIPHLHIWKILFITLTFVHSIWDCVTLLEFYARSNCSISKQFHFGERLPSIKVLFWSNKID